MASLPAPPALGCSGKGLTDLLLSSLESSQPSLGKCTLLVLASFRFHSQFLDISAMTPKATYLNSDFPHQPSHSPGPLCRVSLPLHSAPGVPSLT